MATFNKVNDAVLNMMEVIDFDNDTFMIALSNTAPGSEASDPSADGNGVIANVTQIAYTNYSDDLTADRTLTSGSTTHGQTSGTFTFDYTADITITASGGALPDFRYIYLYSDTPTSPADPIVCYWDHGSTISLGDGDSATLQINASGIFTLT